MDQVHMDPWPNLYDHNDDYDYHRDVRTAGNIARNINKEMREHLHNMEDAITFDFRQLITKLEQSGDPEKDAKIKDLQERFDDFIRRAGKADEKMAEESTSLIEEIASLPDLNGIDHMCHVDVDLCIDLLKKLISIWRMIAKV